MFSEAERMKNNTSDLKCTLNFSSEKYEKKMHFKLEVIQYFLCR
jgi:hypothetical protein